MPKCQTCGKYFGPNYCVIVNEQNGDLQCVFCYKGKDEIVEVDKSGKEHKVTKQYAEEAYRRYIKELYNSRKVQDLIKPKSNIIKPY